MENKSDCVELLVYPSPVEYYNDIAEFILPRIKYSPSPDIAYLLAGMLYHLSEEIISKHVK